MIKSPRIELDLIQFPAEVLVKISPTAVKGLYSAVGAAEGTRLHCIDGPESATNRIGGCNGTETGNCLARADLFDQSRLGVANVPMPFRIDFFFGSDLFKPLPKRGQKASFPRFMLQFSPKTPLPGLERRLLPHRKVSIGIYQL